MNLFQTVTDDSSTGTSEIRQLADSQWVGAALIMVAGIAIAIFVAKVLRRLVRKVDHQGFTGLVVARIASYSIVILAFLYVLNILDVRIIPLLGAFGVGGIILALALQRLVENLVAGVVLHSRRPFTLGDTVEIDGTTGVVLDIDARTTVLKRLDGVVERIPNSTVVTEHISTLTFDPLRRSEIVVGVQYDSNLEHAHQVIVDALARLDRVAISPAPTALLTEFGPSSIDYTVHFWHGSDIPSGLAAKHDVILGIHRALESAGIRIAFPQLTIWRPTDPTTAPYATDTHHIRSEHDLPEGVRPTRSSGRLRSAASRHRTSQVPK